MLVWVVHSWALFFSLLGSAVISVPQIKGSVLPPSTECRNSSLFQDLRGYLEGSYSRQSKFSLELLPSPSGLPPSAGWGSVPARILFSDGPCPTFFSFLRCHQHRVLNGRTANTNNKQFKIKIRCFLKLDFSSFLENLSMGMSWLSSSGSSCVPFPKWTL